MAKTGNTLGKLIAVPVISGVAQDANPAIIAETPNEKKVLANIIQEVASLSKSKNNQIKKARADY